MLCTGSWYPSPPRRDMGPEIPTPTKRTWNLGSITKDTLPPPLNRLTDTCEKITFLQLLLRAVNIVLFINNLLDILSKGWLLKVSVNCEKLTWGGMKLFLADSAMIWIANLVMNGSFLSLLSWKCPDVSNISNSTNHQIHKVLPHANVVCEGYVFTDVCLSTGCGRSPGPHPGGRSPGPHPGVGGYPSMHWGKHPPPHQTL